jgi:hypothetical protein
MDAPQPTHGAPHVFILGAGASLAAFPEGDRHGKRLPLMNNFIETLGLQSLLEPVSSVLGSSNFEEVYSRLLMDGTNQALAEEVEHRVFDYFSQLRLPARPTLYDHLVLSLRPKDLIATFNWDPFLVQAIVRNQDHAALPNAVFLHGNVAVAYCTAHKPIGMGTPGTPCPGCGQTMTPSRLLFPILEKNYTRDPAVAAAWRIVRQYLESAFALTIFGFGAPASDVEAVELLKQGWGHAQEREFEETEIIDIANRDELIEKWSPFIHSHHYRVETSFYDSLAGRSPRRSCEQLWKAHLMAEFITEFPISADWDWRGLRDALGPLLSQEAERAPDET